MSVSYILDHVNTSQGENFYQKLLESFYQELGADYLFIARIDTDIMQACTISLMVDGKLADNFSYPLANTPCANVQGNKVCVFPHNVQHLYPQDLLLSEMGVKGYAGVPLCNNENNVFAILVAMYRDEIDDAEELISLFRLFSGRLSSEIMREDAVAQLKESNRELKHKIQLLNDISRVSKTGGWEYNLEKNELFCTQEAIRLQDVNKHISVNSQSKSPGELQLIERALQQIKVQGDDFSEEIPLIDENGNKRWIKSSCRIRQDNGETSHWYGVLEDITEHKQWVAEAKERANYLESVLNNLNDAVLTVDKNGIIMSANAATSKIFGYERDEIIGSNVSLLMPPEYAEVHQRYMSHYLSGGQAKIIGVGRELPAQKKNGEVFYMELSLSELELHGESIFVGIIKDMTERKKAVEDIYQLAYFDQTTGLSNFKSFETKMREVIDKASLAKGEIYCCLLNIDQFWQYNMAYGKDTGDFILKTVAQRIESKLPKGFKVFKGMGDSFLILALSPLAGTDKGSQIKLNDMIYMIQRFIAADTIFHGLSHKISCRASSVMVEASLVNYEKLIGILEFGQQSSRKKGLGGNTALSKKDFDEYDRTTFISNSFGQALREDEFYAVLQPQIDKNGRVVASELLLRWEHGKLGNIRPDEFIPLAEHSEDIIDISRWVVQKACGLLSHAKEQGIDSKIAINISGNHIARHDFAQDILDITEVWEVDPEDLILEITETALVNNIELVNRHITELSDKGFCFSIDDFGTGYSSLSYLKALPIHELKIDRHFVNEITTLEEEVPLVNSILDMAKALHLTTVAEGIENQVQRDYLRGKGCDVYQGYYYSKPLSEQDWLAFIKDRHPA